MLSQRQDVLPDPLDRAPRGAGIVLSDTVIGFRQVEACLFKQFDPQDAPLAVDPGR